MDSTLKALIAKKFKDAESKTDVGRHWVDRETAMSVLREAISEAMRAKVNESPSIKSRMDDVAEAVAAVKRDLIGE